MNFDSLKIELPPSGNNIKLSRFVHVAVLVTAETTHGKRGCQVLKGVWIVNWATRVHALAIPMSDRGTRTTLIIFRTLVGMRGSMAGCQFCHGFAFLSNLRGSRYFSRACAVRYHRCEDAVLEQVRRQRSVPFTYLHRESMRMAS